MLIMVALAAIYASGGVYAQRSFGGAPPLTAALTVTVLGAVLAAPLGVVGWIADPPTLGAFGALLALGVTSSGIAYIGYFELIRRIGATRTLTVTYLQPAVAIGLGVAILGEELKALHLVGLGLVLLGVAITNARSARAPRSAAAGARAPQAADAAAEPPTREGSRVVREG
jgi:drug/metabolite transporter (DMT)-like permease